MNNNTTTEQKMIEAYLAKNEVTHCKAHYGAHYEEHKGTAKNTKDTYGTSMTTAMAPIVREDEEGNITHIEWQATGWITNMKLAEITLARKVHTLNPEFKERVSKFKALLKRKARLNANKYRTNKKGKVTKYKRREAPKLPTK